VNRARPTDAQRRFLDMVGKTGTLGEVYSELCAANHALPYALAWRTIDRTATACERRGWVTFDGDFVTITEAGEQVVR